MPSFFHEAMKEVKPVCLGHIVANFTKLDLKQIREKNMHHSIATSILIALQKRNKKSKPKKKKSSTMRGIHRKDTTKINTTGEDAKEPEKEAGVQQSADSSEKKETSHSGWTKISVPMKERKGGFLYSSRDSAALSQLISTADAKSEEKTGEDGK
jgi:hypothetical protein